MGKVVKIVVGVAIGVAIAAAAPWLVGVAFGAALGAIGTAVATALVAAGLSLAVGLAFKTMGLTAGAPRVPTSPPPYPQGTACLMPGASPPLTVKSMPAKRDHWLRHFDVWGFGRFKLTHMVGACMSPGIPPNSWGIVDMEAEIREGDLFYLRPADVRTAFAEYGRVPGVVKRFDGLNKELGFLQCSCTNPRRIIHTGLSTLKAAHRLRTHAPTLKEAKHLLREVRRNPEAFDERLAA